MIRRKVRLVLNIIDQHAPIGLLANPTMSYSSTKINGVSKVKYYSNGFDLMLKSDFIVKYGAQRFEIQFPGQYVAVCSLNSKAEENPLYHIFRYRNRVAMGVAVEPITLFDEEINYGPPGAVLDLKKLYFENCNIDIINRKLEVNFTTNEVRDYTETPEDVVGVLLNTTEPLMNEIERLVIKTNTKLSSSERGKELMLSAGVRLLNRLGFFEEDAADVRAALSEKLVSGKSGLLNKYVVDGVVWDDPVQYEQDMRDCHNDIKIAKGYRANLNRISFLLDECSFERRLAELTEQEIHSRNLEKPNVSFAMTDDEVNEWAQYIDLTPEKLFLEEKAINRWVNAVNGRVFRRIS